MAKVSFNKLGLTRDISEVSFEFNGQIIEVKKYLPLDTKLNMISNIVNMTADDNGYYNPCKLDVITSICLIEEYTNITMTDKQKEDVSKLYDCFKSSGLLEQIKQAIQPEELHYVETAINETIKSVYAYKNSALGIVEALKQDYSNTNFNMEAITDILKDNSQNFAFLQEVMDKLG